MSATRRMGHRFPKIAAITALCLTTAATASRADETDVSAICTDRPTKSSGACVVDTGHVQYESDLVNYTRLRTDGTTTETWLVTNPTLKYGIVQNVDVEANIAPWEIVRTRDPTGAATIVRGAGDLFLRVKWNFLPAGDGKLAVAVVPYVKAPTARRGIGNRAVEEGVQMPVNYQLTDHLSLSTTPEVDAFKDSTGTGRHVNTSQLINLGYSLPQSVTIYAELWGDWNVDPAGIVRQYSADAAVAWGITKTLQADAGFNAGLNRATPRVQVYVGISQRF